ncbi:OLC1v1007546C1 [Oldenlandia corymbosa var. corymbosa]|uniref:OLC1v1007546C1 n=1 Tax=Oldenlandia corymbosa var. corymbosa TaxID=529605 RepID=A0AAV1DLW0_OLDCO|nr:OLC1v1007546C1 [Oldenlandia corymbosa var. corymbosa]
MRLWRRASGVMKDQNSLWISSLSRRSSLRNPDIESAVIKATSHDEFSVDYKNAERVYRWIRLSDSHIKPLVWCLSLRMEKTRSWVVALKGLMLMHGVFTCRVPVVQRIGRLPFDLSNFSDGYGKPGEIWAYNAFIRSYYAFLDQKSTLLFVNMQEKKGLNVLIHQELQRCSLMQDLLLLQKLQGLIDMLIQIKPLSQAASVFLIVEAMECILIEIFDIYSRVCYMIARVLKRIDSATKIEAAMAVRTLKKAIVQGDELSSYFELCREIGVTNADGCPHIVEVPEEDIHELEIMINEISERSELDCDSSKQQKEEAQRAIAILNEQNDQMDHRLKTVITDNWEKFDEDSSSMVNVPAETFQSSSSKNNNPFLCSPPPSHQQQHRGSSCPDFPDLISL